MSGDYTRLTFDPRRDYAGVLMQQGRVQVDVDGNNLTEIVDRRWRAETVDIIGRAVVPRETPEAFLVEPAPASSGGFTIGLGRMYVDGLLAENHGVGADEFEPVWGEERGVQKTPYNVQPYYLDPDPSRLPTAGGPHLVYLDVWQREVTALQDYDLVDKAIGVDTANRLQTVWQVRVLPNVGPGATCSTPDGQLAGWATLIAPSAGRLTSQGLGVVDPDDPCLIPPTGGYRGLENRLYRVEIHDDGQTQGVPATFKWSRDNGSVAAVVTAIADQGTKPRLTVDRLGRDGMLRFNVGDRVEVTDDAREFAGRAGEMGRVEFVDQARNEIRLAAPLAGTWPPNRHTRVRRWDQKAGVNANGVVPVASAATPFELEDGVFVTLGLDPATGRLRAGDYWVFAARTADASVEALVQAPPRGIRHHYARLAVVTPRTEPEDCRTLWPPEQPGVGCDCSVCVTPESHNGGTLTIQAAIDRVKPTGGKVCLAPGLYRVRRTIEIAAARSVIVEGRGWTTVLQYLGEGPAIDVSRSLEVTIERLRITMVRRHRPPAGVTTVRRLRDLHIGITIRNSIDVTVGRCLVVQLGTLIASQILGGAADDEAARRVSGMAIGVGGVVLQATLRDNILVGETGIGIIPADPSWIGTRRERGVTVLRYESAARARANVPYLVTFRLLTEDNLLLCRRAGIDLSLVLRRRGIGAIHLGDTRLFANSVYGCTVVGIRVLGAVGRRASPTQLQRELRRLARSPVGAIMGQALLGRLGFGSRLDVKDNVVCVARHGIVVGTDDARIAENDVSAIRSGPRGDGILLAAGLFAGRIDRCQILANRVTRVGGDGIAIRTALGSAMIKHNFIDGVGGGGIVMHGDVDAGALSVENNQLLNVAPQQSRAAATGIRLLATERAAVIGNTISGLGVRSPLSAAQRAIQLVGCRSARVADNEIADLGPTGEYVDDAVGIELSQPFDRLDVADNTVRRERGRRATKANWQALSIAPVETVREVLSSGPADGGDGEEAVASERATALVREVAGGFAVVGFDWLRFLRFGRGISGVRGNLLEAEGSIPTVAIDGVQVCLFGDNRCLLEPSSREPAVRLTAGAAIVNANYLVGPDEAPAMVLRTEAPPELHANIASGTGIDV